MIKLPHKRTEIRLSREDAILVHCARLDLDNERRASIKQQINEGVDWELLLYRAGWQRLSPLVSYHLVSPDMNMLVPESVRKKLQNILFMSLARNMLLQDELSNILAVLNKEEIPVVLLKGAALLQDVYTDIAVRPMSDLDIMVKPENMNRAENILLKQGYEYSEEYILKYRHSNLWNRRKGIMLEVHRHIVDSDSPYNLELEDFWARARCIKVKNNDALVLSPEDTMIHLSINFLSDRRFYSNSALGQLVDLSELILHYNDSLRWNLIEQIAINFKFTTGLHCVLYACAQLLSSQIPVTVMQCLRPRDFNPEVANLFFRQRVLECKPWLAHNLVPPQVTYSPNEVIRSIISRFLHVLTGDLKGKQSRMSNWSFYLRRVKEILPRVGRVIFRPSELREDLLLDRWLHNMYNSGRGPQVR